MILKPFTEDDGQHREIEDSEISVLPPSHNLSGIASVLSSVGLAEDDDEINAGESHVQSIFKKAGGSVEAVARQLTTLLTAADNDATKLRAAETLLKIHGILGRDEEDGNRGPTINITIVGTQNNNLLKVLIPT